MIRIVIVSDLQLLRGALSAILSTQDDLEVTAELGPGCDVVSAAHNLRPDVAIIDLDMAGRCGIRTARALTRATPATAVVALTAQHTPSILREALAAEVRGFVSKEQPPAELTELIRRVAGGDRMIHARTALAALEAADNPLTEREQEVLRLAELGLPSQAIAGKLYLTEGTVRNYLSAILHKLDCPNRLLAARRARDSGWL